MKTLVFLILALIAVPAFAGDGDVDTTLTVRNYFRDTLTATVDTIIVSFSDLFGNDYIVVQVQSGGTDTVSVSTPALDGQGWVTALLIDMLGDSVLSGADLPATTTLTQYRFVDPQPGRIRFITADGVASTILVIGGKRGP